MADVTNFADETEQKRDRKVIKKLFELKPDSVESIFRLLDLQQR